MKRRSSRCWKRPRRRSSSGATASWMRATRWARNKKTPSLTTERAPKWFGPMADQASVLFVQSALQVERVLQVSLHLREERARERHGFHVLALVRLLFEELHDVLVVRNHFIDIVLVEILGIPFFPFVGCGILRR